MNVTLPLSHEIYPLSHKNVGGRNPLTLKASTFIFWKPREAKVTSSNKFICIEHQSTDVGCLVVTVREIFLC